MTLHFHSNKPSKIFFLFCFLNLLSYPAWVLGFAALFLLVKKRKKWRKLSILSLPLSFLVQMTPTSLFTSSQMCSSTREISLKLFKAILTKKKKKRTSLFLKATSRQLLCFVDQVHHFITYDPLSGEWGASTCSSFIWVHLTCGNVCVQICITDS